MVNYKYFDLFYRDNTDIQAKIEYDGGVITNEELFQNSEELTESLCSENELRFGCCEASSFRFKVANIVKSLKGEWITYSLVPGHHDEEPIRIGRYKVDSDKLTADRRYREIVAYDVMQDILSTDMAGWYNAILPNKDTKITMRQFRTSFVSYFGLQETVPVGGLINDNMIVERTIQPEQISGKDIITAICEINGCFGRIGRDGKFHYIYLLQNIQGLYPANFLFPDHVPEEWNYLPQAETGHLYPQDPKGTGMGNGRYIECKYEDYIVRQVNKLQIRQEENDIGVVYPPTEPSSKDNSYIIEDNFLVYGKGTAELNIIAQNIYNRITGIVYRPFNAKCVGNPCLEVGDPIRMPTKYHIVESYILTRRLKGVQALRDTYTSSGNEKRAEKVNGVQKSIIQLKGKSNVLTRNIEETRQEMKDADEQLSSTISQTAKEIRSELKSAKEGLESTISQTAQEIRQEVKKADEGLAASIKVNAEGISQRVEKGKVSSEISQEAGKVEIRANRLVVESDQFQLDGNGNATFGGRLSAASGSFSGEINANRGTFNNVTITESCSVAGQSITGRLGSGYGGVSWGGDTIGGGYIGDGINGGYVGSGISGSNITSGTVGNSRITSNLIDKTFTNNSGGQPITLKGTGGTTWIGSTGASFASGAATIGTAGIAGSRLSITGEKKRVAQTKNYGQRSLYCYEMPSPMFGDVGEGKTDETGTCIIFLDDIFTETIDEDCQYQVFLQEYGPGKLYVKERSPHYFTVMGDSLLEFGWELKAIQRGFDTMRLEIETFDPEEPDLIEGLENYMNQLLYDTERESEEIL